MQLIWNLCFFIVGLVGGSLWINGLSIDLLEKLSLIVTAVAATSAGAFNLVKMAQQKKQQRWELQKPMLLTISKLCLQANRELENALGWYMPLKHDYELSDEERDEYAEHALKEHSSYDSVEVKLKVSIEDLKEIWLDVLSLDYLQALAVYLKEVDEITREARYGSFDNVDFCFEQQKVLEELQKQTRKACIKLSGVTTF